MTHGSDGAGERRRGPVHFIYQRQPPIGSLGAALRRDREATGMTQAEVTAKLGFSQGKLSAYELGRITNPPPQRLADLERLYGRPVGYYVDLAGYPASADLLRELEDLYGALIIREPRPGIIALLDIIEHLSDEALQHIITVAQHEQQATQRRATDDSSPTVRDSA